MIKTVDDCLYRFERFIVIFLCLRTTEAERFFLYCFPNALLTLTVMFHEEYIAD